MGKLVTIPKLGSVYPWTLMSMCLNNYVARAVEINWSAFVQSTVEIKIPWQMAYLLQGNSHIFPRKFVCA